ncbi:kielin/chordin-like protein isoform X2 [Dysidea avara]|uniref:kielin/chordin-like protein isoform X2 n=1 Tax=Dysidea avara TaxID=196820 RepID=UPI003331936F
MLLIIDVYNPHSVLLIALVKCALPECATGVGTGTIPGQCCPSCVCRVGNRTLFPGDTYPLDCNTCACTKNGLVACTEKACLPADPCESVTCPTGSQCEVFEQTGETFCNTSCDLDNGGCPTGQTLCQVFTTCNNPGPVMCALHPPIIELYTSQNRLVAPNKLSS